MVEMRKNQEQKWERVSLLAEAMIQGLAHQ